MTTNHVSAFQCIKAGAGYACLWAAGLACILLIGGMKVLDIDETLAHAILIGSLAAVAVGIPAWRDAKFRNPASCFFLAVGAVLVTALLAVLAGVAFMLYLFLGSGGRGHR